MPESIAALVPGALRRPVKRAFRAVGVATSTIRPLPDYLIIGTHRAGTTSLHECLLEHPCVAPNFPSVQRIKGVRYFDEHFRESVAWYRSHFPTVAYRGWLQQIRRQPVLAGEASPYYLFHPLAAQRAATILPKAKLIVLLRNPIDRAYSHWRRERRDGTEPLSTFEAAVDAEYDRIEGEADRIVNEKDYYSYAHENFSYIAQGLYFEPLRTWLNYYPRERIHVELSEHFFVDPESVYDRVLRFLDLPAFQLRHSARANSNHPSKPLSRVTRRRLASRIVPHNRRLEELLGMDLGWDAISG
jgi:hypothetical protein